MLERCVRWALRSGASLARCCRPYARGARAAAPARRRPRPPITPPDPRLLDEHGEGRPALRRDGRRSTAATARQILKRAYQEKIKEINAKYDPQIDLNDREARDRRRDAIAMFEAFLLKYPNDKRWTPDAMFRLAELYYEKSAEEYLDADEAYKKAHRQRRTRPTTPPPRVDYTPTINLYRRLLTEFPNYRFLDAAYYLLGFCLGEMGEERAGQAGVAGAGLRQQVQAARPAGAAAASRRRARHGAAAAADDDDPTRTARRSARTRSSSPRPGRASASSTSTTRTS